MRIAMLVLVSLLLVISSFSQTIPSKIARAYQQFENDPQLKHATSSLYIIDAKTGKTVFDKNSTVGLAPASTQKIITAATAFELLGKNYRFKTVFTGNADKLYVAGFGDPSLGSWRYDGTKDTDFFEKIIKALKEKGIDNIKSITAYDNVLDKILPSGWINEDIGNYYGAGAHDFNWHENQYDISFIPGSRTGDMAEIDTANTARWWDIVNNCKTGPRGSGDNAYIYFVPGQSLRVIQGTVPAGSKRFSISGTDPSPAQTFLLAFMHYAATKNFFTGDPNMSATAPWQREDSSILREAVYTNTSPALDSIVYWFLKKSINLYGEALVKTFAREQSGAASTDKGVEIVKKFWKQKGIEEDELNMSDGSGLSPQNRVTTHAQVEILKYAKSRDWFPYFYTALPEYNGMKMKSGTIRDVKSFCGYHKSTDGHEYIFSFIVNNYNGTSSSLVGKMYKVLDILK